jgi:DNA-binding protein H-NS
MPRRRKKVTDTGDNRSTETQERLFDFNGMPQDQLVQVVFDAMDFMTAESLTAAIRGAEERRKEKEDDARTRLLQRFREEAAAGLSLDSLFPGLGGGTRRRRTDAGQPLAPKYRHPTDSSQTWSGRGQKAKWLRELEAQGHNAEEFRIKQEGAA